MFLFLTLQNYIFFPFMKNIFLFYFFLAENQSLKFYILQNKYFVLLL